MNSADMTRTPTQGDSVIQSAHGNHRIEATESKRVRKSGTYWHLHRTVKQVVKVAIRVRLRKICRRWRNAVSYRKECGHELDRRCCPHGVAVHRLCRRDHQVVRMRPEHFANCPSLGHIVRRRPGTVSVDIANLLGAHPGAIQRVHHCTHRSVSRRMKEVRRVRRHAETRQLRVWPNAALRRIVDRLDHHHCCAFPKNHAPPVLAERAASIGSHNPESLPTLQRAEGDARIRAARDDPIHQPTLHHVNRHSNRMSRRCACAGDTERRPGNAVRHRYLAGGRIQHELGNGMRVYPSLLPSIESPVALVLRHLSARSASHDRCRSCRIPVIYFEFRVGNRLSGCNQGKLRKTIEGRKVTLVEIESRIKIPDLRRNIDIDSIGTDRRYRSDRAPTQTKSFPKRHYIVSKRRNHATSRYDDTTHRRITRPRSVCPPPARGRVRPLHQQC